MGKPYKEQSLFSKQVQETRDQEPVECLGMSFENDQKRQEYFLEKLREKLQDPEFRKIEGFPIGEDEDILAISDPPYYTACPNPFIEDFIRHYGKPYDPETDNYRREPFAADVSEGKNDPIYNAHSYHTKVPHKAIMRYILHYTEPGDVVFDGFCGTGMTGVAAQLCGDRATVELLGYKVDKDDTIYQQETDENGKTVWKLFSKLGARRAILNDLSPAATFIAYNYNTPADVKAFEREAKRILKDAEEECGWMYRTVHSSMKNTKEHEEEIKKALLGEASCPSWLTLGRINYTVWSDVFVCPECTKEVVFWEAAVDKNAGKVHDEFLCPHCSAGVTKRSMERAWVTRFDKAINQTIRQAKQIPVIINYSVGKERIEKTPDFFDRTLIDKIENNDIPFWFPTDRTPEGDESRRNDDFGFTHVHHFYTKRNLWLLGKFINFFIHSTLFPALLFWINAANRYLSRLSKLGTEYYFHGGGGAVNAGILGTLYIPSFSVENNVSATLETRLPKLLRVLQSLPSRNAVTEARSSSIISITSNQVDYIFTDPPFGGNLMYSELNFLWEAWLKVFTNNKQEAIENKVQGKGILEYQELMTHCFREYYRVLKPSRWITVEFHNSRNSIWNAIQEALQRAGFVIADVRTLDKKQGTFKQVTSAGAVKQDLIISAYKPNGGLEQRFKIEAGTEEGVWDFVKTHMRQLPVFLQAMDGRAEVIAERQDYLLFDRMVAFHVQRGVSIPISASDFYAGLKQRFSERDRMYFLSEQIAEYDKKRLTVREVQQPTFVPRDEASAILWLRKELENKPQTFQELHPGFMKGIAGWAKHEKSLELREILEQNFLSYDGKGPIPEQIWSWMQKSSTLRERMKEKDRETVDASLRAEVKDRWYVPDPNKAGDLEKVRERALLREFEEYCDSKQKRLKVFRLEAVRAGFKKAWQERDYATIIAVARKIPENVLQEDSKLLMWYDQALTRTGERGYL